MAKMTGFKVYKGTKESFISNNLATANANAIVFITGGSDSSASCVFAQGTYFANYSEFMSNYIASMNYVKGINVGGTSYNAAAGGGYVAFGASDPATIAVNAGSNGVEIGLTEEFVSAALKEEVYFIPTAFDSESGTCDSTLFSTLQEIGDSKVVIARIRGVRIPCALQWGLDSVSLIGMYNEKTPFRITITGEGYTATFYDLALESYVDDAVEDLIGASTDASSANTIYGAKKYAEEKAGAVEEKIGDVDDLSTANKEVVAAINEVLNAVGAGGTAAAVTMTTTGASTDYAQSYVIKQGNTTVGTINIPKELVVESGEVVTNPIGKPAGTYIKLVLQNVSAPLFIDVAKLVDVYTAQTNATQVQLAVDASNVISATIVAGSVTATELASNAVTTVKIADANVTKAKLSSEVQTSLGKADAAAPQSSTYTKAEVDRLIESIDVTDQLANYYTKTEVDAMWEWEEL